MTEQEYIDVSDLAKIRMASNILFKVLPENSKIVKRAEYVKVMRLLGKWEDQLSKHIKVIPTEE